MTPPKTFRRPPVRGAHPWRALRRGVLLVALIACGGDPVDPPAAAEATDTVPVEPRYAREYHFLGISARQPVSATLSFTASPRGTHLQRTARGWLARGEEWDRFLDLRWSSSGIAGVWRIVPHEGLYVLAGGPDEVEAIAFRRGDRALRLYPGEVVSTWVRREEHRVTVRRGILEIAQQPVSGYVIETFLVESPESPLRRSGVTFDRAILTDGDQRLFVFGDGEGEEGAKQLGWGVLAGMEERWGDVELRWLHVRPEAQARRDVPVQWSVRSEEGGIEGELVSLVHDLDLGPDAGARRAVEMHNVVEGWLIVDGEQIAVFGVLKHVQR